MNVAKSGSDQTPLLTVPLTPSRSHSPRRYSLRFLLATGILLSTGATCTKNQTTSPPAAAAAVEAPAPPPTLDADRMLGVLEVLASDDLGGRYTLSPDIVSAAELVGKHYAASGVQPVGANYIAPFSLVTGVSNSAPPTLSVVSAKGKATSAKAERFVALPASGSGNVEAELVFVGYAAQGTDDSGAVTYDDLAGVDLTGKVAIVLDEAPSQPSYRELYRAISDEVDRFETKAAPLREAGKSKALAKQHVALRKRVGKLAEPFLRGTTMPDDFFVAPDDLDAEVRTSTLTKPLYFVGGNLDGPKFGPREGRVNTKLERLTKAGAAAIVVVKGPRSFVTADALKKDRLPTMERGGRPIRETFDIPVVQMSWKEADRLLRGAGKLSARQKKVDTTLTPQSGPLAITARIATAIEHETAEIPNVLGMIPGGELANEIVMVGAHYDHIGRDEGGPGHCRAKTDAGTTDDICNGADDNGSGTAIVVELARAIAESGVQPKRTLVFALFAGEELGLLGSEAMAAQLPTAAPFDTGKIVAMINIDMVGRLRPDLGLAVGGVGSSSGWMPLLDGLDDRGLPIMFDRATTTRSDHASFYRQNIPVLFFFTHVHDDYHAPGDEMAQINREGMSTIANYVLDITRTVADGYTLPFTPSEKPSEGLVGALPGDNPDTIVKRIGFAEPESPAAEPEPPAPDAKAPATATGL